MTIFEIQKQAYSINKSNYLKSFTFPLCALITTVILTTIPHIIVFAFNLFEYKIPERYILYSNLIKLIFCALITILSFMFYSSSALGEKAYYSGRIIKRKNNFKRLCYWFNPHKSIKALSLKALIFTLKLFWTFILLLPFTVVTSLILAIAFSGGIELYLLFSLSSGALILLITGLVFRFIIIQRYFLAEYIMTENPELRASLCVKRSKNLLDGHMFKVVKFKLSFLPMFLSCVLILPLIFVYPHYKQCRSIIAKDIIV